MFSVAKGAFAVIDRFDFETGGELDLTWKSSLAKSKGINFSLCTRTEWDNFLSINDTTADICVAGSDHHSEEYDTTYTSYKPTEQVCEITAVNFLDPILRGYKVKERERYTLVITNCGTCEHSSCFFSSSPTTSVQVRYSLTNPSCGHLSLSEQNNPSFYVALTNVWLILLLVMAILTLRQYLLSRRMQVAHRSLPDEVLAVQENDGQPLHIALTIMVLSKLLVSAITAYWWEHEMETGTIPLYLTLLSNGAFAVSECLLFGILLLVSSGWCTLSGSLDLEEARTMTSSMIVLLSTLMFFSLYDNAYYFISLLVLYFCLLPKTFAYLARNVDGSICPTGNQKVKRIGRTGQIH